MEGQWSSKPAPGNTRCRMDALACQPRGRGLHRHLHSCAETRTAEQHPSKPASSRPPSQAATLLTLTKVAHLGKQKSFPKHQAWPQFQIWVAGTLLSLLLLLAGMLVLLRMGPFLPPGLAHNRPFCITVQPLIQLIISVLSRTPEITRTPLLLEPGVTQYSDTASKLRVNSDVTDTGA